jgi:hypothetical protein
MIKKKVINYIVIMVQEMIWRGVLSLERLLELFIEKLLTWPKATSLIT